MGGGKFFLISLHKIYKTLLTFYRINLMVKKKYSQPALQIIKAESFRLMSGSGDSGGGPGGSGDHGKDRWANFNLGIVDREEEIIEGEEITFD